MKLFRFKNAEGNHYGVKDNEDYYKLQSDPFEKIVLGDKIEDSTGLEFIVPVEPSKVIGIGINYFDHIEDQNIPRPESPYIFLKPIETLLPQDGILVLPNGEDLITCEAELVVVIKQKCKNVAIEDVDSVILGYTVANDATQKSDFIKEHHMGKAKAYDTFTPMGRFVDMDLKTKDVKNLPVILKINHEIKQSSNTENMIFSVEYLINFLSSVMTLMPGDIILTGTPKGPAKIKDGDIVEISVGTLNKLSHRVKL